MDIVPHKLENREGNCRQCDNVALQVGCGEARARARERRKLHAAAYGARKTVFRALRRGSRYQQPGRGANRARFSVQCELSWGARNERRRNGRVIVTSRDKKVVQVVTWARWILRLRARHFITRTSHNSPTDNAGGTQERHVAWAARDWWSRRAAVIQQLWINQWRLTRSVVHCLRVRRHAVYGGIGPQAPSSGSGCGHDVVLSAFLFHPQKRDQRSVGVHCARFWRFALRCGTEWRRAGVSGHTV